MTYSSSMPLGVVIARHDVDSPWQDHVWRPAAVLLGAPPVDEWRELARGQGWVQYLAANATVELHRKETEAYKFNLEGEEPVLYVVLAADDDPESPHEVRVSKVTASPFEAQDYLDSGEEIVEPVPMPEAMVEWLADYIAEHHVEEKFKKRKRDEVKIEDYKFGQEPIHEVRRRMAGQDNDG
ncbi:MAG: DUF3305 domain-containing protein [Pseudomonadota bacterium]|nr:DUF3305 domain-containing protein [Pseudomonadota bacterium]